MPPNTRGIQPFPSHPSARTQEEERKEFGEKKPRLHNLSCWGINYTEPTAQIRGKIETILHTWGEQQPKETQDEVTKLNLEREGFSVPHASRDPRIIKDMNLENQDIL